MTYSELNAALDLSRKIDRLEGQLSGLEDGGIGSPTYGTSVQGGTGAVGIGQIASEVREEIDSLKQQLKIEQEIVRRFLEKQELNENEKSVMMLRYVSCLPFKYIQQRKGYERSRVFDFHKAALENIGLHRTSSDL